jgi:hypothetical protein
MKNENMNLINEINIIKENKKECDEEEINYKNNIKMLTNEINNDKNVIEEKNEIIEQLKSQINEIENEILEKDKELNEFDESKQNEINDYIQKIEELAKEKMLLEKQNEELTNNLSIANDNLKELNDLVIDKYSNMENELYKQKTQKKNIEKKYKGMIKQIKSKEKGIVQENSQLKEILNNQDNSNKLQNLALYQNALGKDNLNRTMFNIPVNNNLLNDNNNNSVVIDSNNQRNILNNNTLNFANNKRINNIQNMPKLEDPNDDGQKKTLEEFKELLQKIDEKLDINKK